MSLNRLHTRQLLELSFETVAAAEKPYVETSMEVSFASPDGDALRVPGFRDGGRLWKVRFAPEREGRWSWRSVSDDPGLNGREGEFEVTPYEGDVPFYRRGRLTVHPSGRGFAHTDGTPFFWLGDTAWAVPAHAEPGEWEEYLAVRAPQGFNIAQITTLPQWDASGAPLRHPFARRTDERGETVYDVDRPDPDYFRFLDDVVSRTVEAGLVPAIVAIWFNYVPRTNLNWGFEMPRPAAFSPEQARRYATFLAARYAAFGPVWLVSGDTDFAKPEPHLVYDAAARAIEAASPYPAVKTVHMVGGMATPEEINAKPWLDFHMVQSGHSFKSAATAKRLALKDRALRPIRPVLNGEPCYESIAKNDEGRKIADREFVRSAEWASVLGGGNAGITYGLHGIWPWHRPGTVYGTPMYGDPIPWREGLRLESGNDAARLKAWMERLEWWELEPTTDVGFEPEPAVSAASAAADGRLVAAYVSEPCALSVEARSEAAQGIWFDPGDGRTSPAELRADGTGRLTVLPPPWNGDAAIVIEWKEDAV